MLEYFHQAGLNKYADACHKISYNVGWWYDETYNNQTVYKAMKLALIHSEVSEALEAVRKQIADDHLPEYPMEHVELVDVLIRVFDYAGHYGIDLDAIFRDKMNYNINRADHKAEARKALGGKVI